MNRYGANGSPCRTPAIMPKKWVYPSGCTNLDSRVTIEYHYISDIFFGGTQRKKYLLRLPSLYGFKCLGGIFKQECCLYFLARTPSMIQCPVGIHELMDRLYRKPFRIFTMSSSMRLRSRALYVT